MQNVLILTDYRDQFWLKTDFKEQSVDVHLLARETERLGYAVSMKSFDQIDFSRDNYYGFYVFYQSSQDPDLFYKSYIEDILSGLKLQGAILLPDIQYFRAHHNKVFMEILRSIYGNEGMKLLKSWQFGTYEEFKRSTILDTEKNYVFKLSTGDQSKNVVLLDNRRKFKNVPKKQSRSFNMYYWLIDQVKPVWKSRYPGYRKKSHHRRKFIIQEFIPGLTGDFKILVFGGRKIFVLARETKPDDFRASGSGRFSFAKDIPHQLLDFSLEVYNTFSVPFISLDVAVSDGKFFLLEFQFVSFGTYTAEKSPFHFEKVNGDWITVDNIVVIETEYAEAIDSFIQKTSGKVN